MCWWLQERVLDKFIPDGRRHVLLLNYDYGDLDKPMFNSSLTARQWLSVHGIRVLLQVDILNLVVNQFPDLANDPLIRPLVIKSCYGSRVRPNDFVNLFNPDELPQVSFEDLPGYLDGLDFQVQFDSQGLTRFESLLLGGLR